MTASQPPKRNHQPRNPNLLDQHAGEVLRAIRLAQRLSQTQLATMVDLSYQQIQKYEAGRNRISLGRFHELCKALEVSPIDVYRLILDQSGSDLPKYKVVATAPTGDDEEILASRADVENAIRALTDSLFATPDTAPTKQNQNAPA